MDSLQSYKGNDSASDPGSDFESNTDLDTRHPTASDDVPCELDVPPSSPNRFKKRRVVTGTIETFAISDQNFNNAQKLYDKSLTPSGPISKRPRPAHPRRSKSPQFGTSKLEKSSPSPVQVPTSSFHLPAAHDFQNRPWHHPPANSRKFEEMETYTPFIPKVSIWQNQAHSKPASVISFSRPHGNILLSAGLDGQAKAFNVSSRRLARTYKGHSEGIRHAVFHPTAETFLSAGYDRRVLLWSTETGQVRASFRTRGIPICLAFTPNSDHEFLVASSDRRVLQLDMRDANQIVQSYDQHMGSVNALSFIDQGRRFVSSSDDKVLRVWEYGVPVVIKYVTDPSMHSMPFMLLHPNQRSLACQSMDNTVRIYTAKDKFKRNDKKVFRGQFVAGYACGLTFSPDGRFLGSGDSMGRLFFWDWKTARLYRTLQAHKSVCIGLDWHPTLPSLVASCGWDGGVKLWD